MGQYPLRPCSGLHVASSKPYFIASLRISGCEHATAFAATALVASWSAFAQQAPKPEQLVKWRQSAYQVIAWNTGRVKANVEGKYNKDEVVKAANVIASLANSGLGSLFAAGTESGKGWHDTAARPELFKDARVGELAGNSW